MPATRDGTVLGHVVDVARERVDRVVTLPAVTRLRRRSAARLTDLAHRTEGLAYRIAGRQPDPDADDVVLAARVRSQLGPLERRLDVPRLHVTVHDHVAEVRGVVGDRSQADTLAAAIRAVPGIASVRSLLRVGYGSGDTTPSQGRARHQDSAAWRELVGSLRAIDVDEHTAATLAAGTLAALFAVLPTDERAHVRGHLPLDVLGHVDDVVRVGQPDRPRRPEDVITAVADTAHVTPGTAELAIRQAFATLRDLVPEEAADVEAVLPGDLKPLWRAP